MQRGGNLIDGRFAMVRKMTFVSFVMYLVLVLQLSFLGWHDQISGGTGVNIEGLS